MKPRKSNVQVTLDSTSIAVLKALLYQVEQVNAKREQRREAKHSMAVPAGQLSLLTDPKDEKGVDA